jgi:hypothetical protein
MVQGWVDRKEAEGGTFKHHTIEITAGPWRPYAVSYESKDGVLKLDFYAALRAGFGAIPSADVTALISIL